MSFFFFLISLVLFGINHYWASMVRPMGPLVDLFEKKFSGDSDSFRHQLRELIDRNQHLEIMEETKHSFLINEQATWLHFGYYYYIQYREQEQHLVVKLAVQGKLITSIQHRQYLANILSHELSLEDVS